MKLFSRPTRPSVPIIGVMRFSVLSAKQNAFRQMTDLDVEARKALLFAPARLEEHFRFFEALSLPSLTAQQGDDWHQIILHSDELPEPWMSRLKDLVAPHRHIHLHAMGRDGRLAQTVQRLSQKFTPAGADRRVTFRIDDDDALSSGYIPHLRRMLDIYPTPGTAFTFPSGYALQVDEGQSLRLNAQVRVYGIGIGLAVLSRLDGPHHAYKLGAVHTRVDQSMPTVSDASERMFIVAAHGSNDSERGAGTNALTRIAPQPVAGVTEALGPHFAHLALEKLF